MSATASGLENQFLQVGVTGGQHGGEPRHFFFAAAFLAGLFKGPALPYGLERTLAVDFFLQSPQCFIYWLAFFEFNLGQTNSLPLQKTRDARPSWRAGPLESGAGSLFFHGQKSTGKIVHFVVSNLFRLTESLTPTPGFLNFSGSLNGRNPMRLRLKFSAIN